MSREQRLRAFLFYLSLVIFIAGLPFILSFALGFKFNTHTFKFTKTGLIALKTQPSGAEVYLNGKLLNEKTPASIQELLPGNYRIALELEEHYPWSAEVNVEAGRVTRLEKIILFPLRQNIKQLNKDKISFFWQDTETKEIYYIDQENGIIYNSDLNGEHFRKVALLPENFSTDVRGKISPDKERLLCFNQHKIAVMPLEDEARQIPLVILNCPDRNIIDVFWHSDSFHLILLTDKDIEVVETKLQSNPVKLESLNKRDSSAYYITDTDTLYFIDSQQASDGRFYDNIYKLELGSKFYPLQNFMKIKTNQKEK